MISNAGRIVCAVVCAAPETMPSAMPSCAPSSCRSRRRRRRSRGPARRSTPLCLRSSAYSSANRSRSSLVVRVEHRRAPTRSTPSSAARARICGSSPRRVRSATPRRSSRAGRRGCGRRRPRAARCACGPTGPGPAAGSSNISGVTTDGIGMASCASRSAVSTCSSNSASAVSILRCELAVTRPRAAATRLAVSKVPNLGRDDRQPQPEPGHQRRDRRMQLEAAVEDDAGQRREAFGRMGTHHGEHHVGAVARRDDGHALGQPLQHVLGASCRPPARPSPRGTAAPGRRRSSVPSTAFRSSATDGATSSGSSGST